MVQALTNPQVSGGTLIQAFFYNGYFTLDDAATAMIGPLTPVAQRRLFSEQLKRRISSVLPAYRWIATAELQNDTEELVALALTYDDIETAQRAAKIVAQRVHSTEIVPHKVQLGSMFDVDVDSHVRVSDDWSLAVAVVTLRRPYVASAKIDLGRHGKLAKTIFQALHWHQFTALAVNDS